jgi:hypothetical protein
MSGLFGAAAIAILILGVIALSEQLVNLRDNLRRLKRKDKA